MFVSVTSTARVRSSDLDGRICGWTTAQGREGVAEVRAEKLTCPFPPRLAEDGSSGLPCWMERVIEGRLRVLRVCPSYPDACATRGDGRVRRDGPRFGRIFREAAALPPSPPSPAGSRRSGPTFSEVSLFNVSALVIKVSPVCEGHRGRVRCPPRGTPDAALPAAGLGPETLPRAPPSPLLCASLIQGGPRGGRVAARPSRSRVRAGPPGRPSSLPARRSRTRSRAERPPGRHPWRFGPPPASAVGGRRSPHCPLRRAPPRPHRTAEREEADTGDLSGVPLPGDEGQPYFTCDIITINFEKKWP